MKVGRARISVHRSGTQACSSCGKCLSGCQTDSIWAPKKGDFRTMGHDVDFVQATAVSFQDDGRRVSVTATMANRRSKSTAMTSCWPWTPSTFFGS